MIKINKNLDKIDYIYKIIFITLYFSLLSLMTKISFYNLLKSQFKLSPCPKTF